MKEHLREYDWNNMRSMSADEAAEMLTEQILKLADLYIGKKYAGDQEQPSMAYG